MNIIKIAHTGCGLRDNSLEFIEKVVTTSADIVEVDVNYTSDRRIILYHDLNINVNGNLISVEDLTYDQVKEKEPSIMLLSQVMSKIINAGKLVNLDIKSTKCLPDLIFYVKENDFSDHVIFTGCDDERVAMIRELDKKLPIIYSPNESKYRDVSKKELMRIGEYAIVNQCSGVNIDYRYVDQDFINHLKRRGLTSFVWTVNDKRDIVEMIKHGVTAITVNEFELIDYIERLNQDNQEWLTQLEGEK